MLPAPFPVVLDANVLYSFILRDTVLRAAELGLCEPYWSAEILDEMVRNLASDGKVSHEGAVRLRAGIEGTFPDALITGHERWLAELENDEKDRHVVAAALEAEVGVIVTSNLSDFVPLPAGMRACSPDDFLRELFERNPDIMLEVLRGQVADFERPPVTYEGLLDHLGQMAPSFVASVRSYKPGAP